MATNYSWRSYQPPQTDDADGESYNRSDSSYHRENDSPNSPELTPQRESSTGPITGRARYRNTAHEEPEQTVQFPSPAASSSAASQSPFPLHDDHPSSNLNPRSASPALSAASAYTSASGASGSALSPRAALFPAALALPPIPPLTIPPNSKQKKQRLFPIDRRSICEYHSNNPQARQEDIATRFGVERSTISKILKQKARWLNIPEETNMKIAKNRGSKFPMIEDELETWLIEIQRTNTPITDAMIRNKAMDVAKGYHEKGASFKASPGWVENFKQRHGIRGGIWHGMGKNTRAALAMGANILPPLNLSPSVQAMLNIPQTSTTEFAPSHIVIDPVQAAQIGTIEEPNGSTSFVVPEDYGRDRDHDMESQAGPSNWAQIQNKDMDHMVEEPRYRIYTPLPNQGGPSMDDAERCIDTLISFIDRTGPEGVLSDDQRDTLTSIKHALHNAQNGMPYLPHS